MTSPLLFILSFLLTLQNAGSSTEERFCQPIDNLTVTESRCSILPHRFSTTSTFSTTYVLHFKGFGGHEYLPWFGIYNANARLYDPLLGRFLSPDPYVQAPGFSVNFNRYAWCLNNPLKYMDPSGELFGLDDATAIIIIGALAGAYTGGVIANEGNYNPFKWDYNPDTFGYMMCGAVFGAISGGIGASVAASSIPMANTVSIMTASLINSVGTNFYTLGETPLSMSFGPVSIDMTNVEWGYFGKKGNTWLQNFGYASGALGSLTDVVSLIKGGAGHINVNSAQISKDDWWGHESITDDHKESLLSIGPDNPVRKGTTLLETYKNSIKNANTNWSSHILEPGTWSIGLNNVSISAISDYASEVTRWDLLFNSCVGHATRALWAAGVPTLYLFHPIMLNIQLAIRQIGIYASPYLYQIP